MKLRMIAGMAGADFALSPGEETDRFSKDEAVRLIEAGYAVPVSGEELEKAVKPAASEKRSRKKA